MIKKLIETYTKTPHYLFLIDAIGALISVLSLGLVLPMFVDYIGMDRHSLHFLASIPVGFAIYSFGQYFLKLSKPTVWLQLISFLNLSYCLLSIYTLLAHKNTLTLLGWSYFLLEIAIVTTLSLIELAVAHNLASRTKTTFDAE